MLQCAIVIQSCIHTVLARLPGVARPGLGSAVAQKWRAAKGLMITMVLSATRPGSHGTDNQDEPPAPRLASMRGAWAVGDFGVDRGRHRHHPSARAPAQCSSVAAEKVVSTNMGAAMCAHFSLIIKTGWPELTLPRFSSWRCSGQDSPAGIF